MNESIAGKRFRYGPVTAVIIVLVLATIVASSFVFVFSLKEKAFEFSSLMTLLGPAFIAALFVERAVEVVVTTWRKLGRERKETELTALEAQVDAAKPDAVLTTQISEAKDEIDKYRQHTLQMAVLFSIAFSFIVTLAGVRLLIQFFEIPFADCLMGLNVEPEDCPTGHEELATPFRLLNGIDIFITTFIIAGGSEGLHSIVRAITKFADRTAAAKPEG